MTVIVDATLMLMAYVKRAINTVMVISVRNGNMLGNIIDVADGVRTSNAQHGNVKK